jgi:hypothetical protein
VISKELDPEVTRSAQAALARVNAKIAQYEDRLVLKRPEPLHVLRTMKDLLAAILSGDANAGRRHQNQFAGQLMNEFIKKRKPSTDLMNDVYSIALKVLGPPSLPGQSLGEEREVPRPVRPADGENSIVLDAPGFPPIDLGALGESEPIFEGVFHRQRFLDREERIQPMPYFGVLNFAKPALEEVVLNGLDAVARAGRERPTVKVSLAVYEPDVYRLIVEQEASAADDWANLKQREQGFRSEGPEYFVKARFPKEDQPHLQTQRNNGFYNLARLMKDTAVLLTYVRNPATGAVRTELFFRLQPASSLGLSVKTLQSLEMKSIPVMRQILEDEYLALERGVRAVWEKAAKREGGIRAAAVKDVRFEYAAIRKSDAEGLDEEDAAVFAKRLEEAGGAFLHFSESDRRYYLFADADFFPAEYIDLAGLHEYAESVLGNHLAATMIEFAAARLEGKHEAYVEWIASHHPAKFANIATHVELEDEAFLPERILKGDDYQTLRSEKRVSPEADKLKDLMTRFQWPAALLRAIRRAEKTNRSLESAIEDLFKKARDKVSELPRTLSWPDLLRFLDGEARAALENLRPIAGRESFNADLARKVWFEQKRYTAGVAAASWAAHARMRGEKEAAEELAAGGIESPELNRYGIFRDSLDIADLLTALDAEWQAAASLGAVRAPLEFVLRIALPREQGGITEGVLFMPDAATLEWALEELGLTGKAPVAEKTGAAVRAFNRGRLTEKILQRTGREFLHPAPIVLFDSLLRQDPSPAHRTAGAISAALEPKDLLLIVFGGENKHEVIDRLIKSGNRRGFRVRTVPEKIVSGALIDSYTRAFSTPPVSVSSLEETGDLELNYPGARVKLNLKELSAGGVRPAALIALIRQLADHPEKFRLAGFTQKEGYWEVGSDFIRLIESLYAEQTAELTRQRAA